MPVLPTTRSAIGLVKDAVNSLEGTVEDKLTAIRKAIRNQTVTLSGKLELIDATLKAGFADNAKRYRPCGGCHRIP